MKKMRNTFRAALKDDDLQKAFDELWRARRASPRHKLTNIDTYLF